MHVAFLFDNDGVLIDSSELHWQSWVLLMKEEPELEMNRKEFTNGFGKRNDLILEELVPHIPKEKRTQWARRKEELFRQCARGKVELLAGIESFLKEVDRAAIPHIIASSTPTENLEMYISSTVLGNYFQHYLSAEEVAHGKPAPDIFIAAADRLGFAPSECVVFEDAPAGIRAGKAAGSFVVALETTHSKEELSDYDLFYHSPSDLNLQEILKAFTVWKKGKQ
ncbi:MAG: HAD family phosphatase [Chlamydiales bacterium]|nr:HAD family phosphatase [Chlamydiales bacterium]